MSGNERQSLQVTPRGFTLLELMIVLAIMAAIAVAAWPRVLPALGRSVPRSAALQLKRDLAEAREEAIRSGETWVFRYQLDSPLYQIAPASWSPQQAPTDPRALRPAAPPSELAAVSDMPASDERSPPLGDKEGASAANQESLRQRPTRDLSQVNYETRELPGDVVFAQPAPPWEEGIELRSEEALRKEEGELLVADDAQLNVAPESPVDDVSWTTGSEFFADGRARDCDLELRPRDSSNFIRVHVRGLTGSLHLGPVERVTPSPAEEQPRNQEQASEFGDTPRDTPLPRPTEEGSPQGSRGPP